MTKIIKTDYSLDKPSELISFANELKKVIVQQKLFTNIQGKNYPHVEAWTFCGAMLGVMPIVKSLKDISSDTVIKYRAEIELKRISTNEIIGSGVAVCSNRERGRQNSDEYAIAGMAQTRAISRAYRNSFAWLLKLAGLQTTPAEEMEVNYNASEDTKTKIVEAYNS